jgi:hypothetical protein
MTSTLSWLLMTLVAEVCGDGCLLTELCLACASNVWDLSRKRAELQRR